jgi:hypothetical protein
MASAPRPHSVRDLRQLELRGESPEFLFFWGHRQWHAGWAGPWCLSQWLAREESHE